MEVSHWRFTEICELSLCYFDDMFYVIISFPSSGSGFSSKPTTPTGSTPFIPPMGSPSRPPPSPQHGFPSWQAGAGGGGGWQPQGQGPAPQPKPSPSHTPMPHTSPGHRPNYNVSFSAMGGGSPSAGVKAQAGMGEQEIRFQLSRSVSHSEVHLILQGEKLMSLNKCFLYF